MTGADSIRVASFNIQHGAKGDYGRGYPGLVAAACKELDADILGLQEVDVGVPRSKKIDLAAIAAEATGMNYVFAKTRTYRGKGRVGNALLVRGDIRNVEVLKLKGDWQRFKLMGQCIEFLPEPRNMIMATTAIRGCELSVGVTHTGGRKNREMLGRAATALLQRSGPHILMGDYNIELTEARDCMSEHGLNVIEGPPTNPSWAPTRQIDHIALNRLRLRRVEAPRLPISDHLALVAEVVPVA
ncbi:MAG TPA: endonuclease/exonuclease/phosphatase family protein [Candidatus Saccharimonadales bacterium]|nr:endonuclease/exonuclease/phosphatase family protein [Candidatus Saccharimonadales bacterium]